jgi:methionyl-tRNA synthetase
MDRCFVPCDHEYLNFKGGKFSKSRSAAVDVPYFLSKYDPDPLRFYVSGQARPYAGRRCSLPSWTSV